MFREIAVAADLAQHFRIAAVTERDAALTVLDDTQAEHQKKQSQQAGIQRGYDRVCDSGRQIGLCIVAEAQGFVLDKK